MRHVSDYTPTIFMPFLNGYYNRQAWHVGGWKWLTRTGRRTSKNAKAKGQPLFSLSVVDFPFTSLGEASMRRLYLQVSSF
jgi:hypothetical protein